MALVPRRHQRDRGRPAHRDASARSCATSASPRPPATTTSSPSSGRCCCSTRSSSSATRTSPAAEHVALAERFGPLEDHPVAGSDPDHPGLVRIYKDLDSKPEHYENAFHCDATWREVPPFGSVLRCVEGPPVGGDTIWVNMAEAYRRLPDAREGADRRPAGAAQHRGQLRRGDARRRSGSPCTSGSPTPSTPSSAPTPRRARRSSSSTRSRRISRTSTRRRTCVSDSTTRPGASELLNYLIRQAAVPEYQVRWRWTPNSFAIWDNRCTQHYAVQDYWPGRPQDGARRNRRHRTSDPPLGRSGACPKGSQHLSDPVQQFRVGAATIYTSQSGAHRKPRLATFPAFHS